MGTVEQKLGSKPFGTHAGCGGKVWVKIGVGKSSYLQCERCLVSGGPGFQVEPAGWVVELSWKERGF